MFNKETSEHGWLDVRVLVEEVIALVQAELQTHRILLQRGTTDQPLQVIGDRIQLQQVLLNLTINAIDAMSSVSGRDRLLTIASGIDENGMVRITVEDMGNGIDPTHLDRILRAFLYDKIHWNGVGALHLSLNR